MSAFRHETIHKLLESQAAQHATRAAIGDGEGFEITYARLLELVNGLIRDMMKAGVQPGERISIVMPNGVNMAVNLLAVSAFATAVPLNPAYKTNEYRSYFKDLGVRWLLLPEDDANPSADVAEEMGIGVLRFDESGSFRISGAGKVRPAREPSAVAAKPDDICLILLTSGSTGRSKKVPLTHRQVLRSTSDICQTLRLTSDDVCLCMWEQFHIGGLVDLLLVPLASGGKVICAGSFSASDLARLLVPESVSWFQAVPTTLHELMRYVGMQGRVIKAPKLRFIRAVASALSPAMMADVEAMFSVPVIQTFGMTEAGPLITTNRLPPEIRKPASVGTSCGPEIRVEDMNGNLLPTGQRGEIVIRGENVITGYEDAPEANQVSFRDGWFRTGDTGYLDADGYLYLTGRIKEMINRGGEKITPQEIDDVLQTHEAIAQAATFCVSHPVLGEDVAAAVVLKPGHSLTEVEIRQFAASRLAGFKVPQKIMLLPEMPRDPVGKINRLTLATLAQSKEVSSDTESKAAAPSGPLASIELRIASIWARELNLPEVKLDDNFFEIGGHSLAGVRTVLAIEAEFGKHLPADVWAKVTTVREVARLISAELAGFAPQPPEPAAKLAPAGAPMQGGGLPAQTIDPAYLRTMQLVMSAGQVHTLPNFPTLKAINPDGDRPPLFWVFNSPEREMMGLKPHWDRDQPLFGMFSGSKNLPRSEEVFDMLARHYASCIMRLCPRGNFYLGGNCRGAKIAFRILDILNQHRVLPRRVILMEHGADALLNYPGDVLLLYGRHSRARAYQSMNIKEVLSGKHPNVRMRWIDGQHGDFFIPMNVELLARKLLAFLKGDHRPQELFEGLKSRLTWHAHASEARFEMLIERYKKKKKRAEKAAAKLERQAS